MDEEMKLGIDDINLGSTEDLELRDFGDIEFETTQNEPEPDPAELFPLQPTSMSPISEQAQFQDDDDDEVSSYVGSDLTPEEEARKKKNLLFKLKRFQKKGFTLSRPYNMESDLADIQAEAESIRKEANLGAGVETMKKGLTVATYLMEMLNNKFDPINAKLDGWSGSVKDDIDSGYYDEVFEELYDKYTQRLDMPPEIKLVSMLGTSALQFHIAQTIVSNTLNMSKTQEILKTNPRLKKDIMNAVGEKRRQRKMNDPSDIDDILQELEIEDENTKIQNQRLENDF